MEAKPIYTLFPQPKPPTTSPPQYRPRYSFDHKRRTSLDPLPPIEEPPHPVLTADLARPESPVLKPIHSLYNPQPARPSSSRGPSSKRHERRKSLNQQQLLPPENPASPLPQEPSTDKSLPPYPHPAQSFSRSSSLKEKSRPPQNAPKQSESPPRPSTAQDMYTNSPTLTLGARVHVPSPSSSSSISLSKPPILSPTSTVGPGKPFATIGGGDQTQHNRTPYFHGGIGGRGNYRKVKREDKRAPLAYAPNARPLNGGTKFLSSFFRGRNRGRMSPGDRDCGEDRTSEDSLNSSEKEEVALGAAEVMRRKLLKQAGVKTYRSADAWEKN